MRDGLGPPDFWRQMQTGSIARAWERALNAVERVSPTLAARGDWQQRWKHDMWGGPMNGQPGRQELVRQLLSASKPTLIVETGTFLGVTTEFLSAAGGVPVYSVELRERFHRFAERRCAGLSDVHLYRGESTALLQELARQPLTATAKVFFYLDAHWYEPPIGHELALIRRSWSDAVVMIDDVEVPDDPAYAFDADLGWTNISHLCADVWPGARLLVPSLPGKDESGARRGCVVIVDPDQAPALCTAGLRALRA